MQEKIKEIISVYIKLPASQINASTIIDRTAAGSSILLHRMYAKLAAENFVVKDYQLVKTFGDLLQGLNGEANEAASPANNKIGPQPAFFNTIPEASNENTGIGIDIEMISAMPGTADFREDAFYTMNFSAQEIAYCILQAKPYVSFAGIFAAKEAIVKADNNFKKIEFKNIVIGHLSNGKPFYTGFNISISHTDEIAVAVATTLQYNLPSKEPVVTGLPATVSRSIPILLWLLTLTSLLLSVIALFYISKKG